MCMSGDMRNLRIGGRLLRKSLRSRWRSVRESSVRRRHERKKSAKRQREGLGKRRRGWLGKPNRGESRRKRKRESVKKSELKEQKRPGMRFPPSSICFDMICHLF